MTDTETQMDMHADDDFTASFDYASGATAERFQNPLWFITEMFLGAKFRRSIRLVKDFGRQIVASAVADRESGKSLSSHGGDTVRLDQISGSLVQSLLETIGNEKVVADAALNYLSAGRDTTAQALTWTFYLLAQHPSMTDKIRNEVRDVLREVAATDDADTRATATLDTTLFTPHSMPYTHAVFYESLRLYPPVPFEIKQCSRPATLPDGTYLPANSVVVWCPWAMNRSFTTWGQDADSFRPERWLSKPDGSGSSAGNKPTITNRSAAEFPVFNGGPRLCLGKKMAELVAVQVIAATAWLFEFTPVGGDGRSGTELGGERVSKSSLTLPMAGGFPVRVKSR